jgi:hypothetical protein
MEAIGSIRKVYYYARVWWAKEKNNRFLLFHKCSLNKADINLLSSEQFLRVSSFGSSGRYDTNVPTAGPNVSIWT